MTIRLSCKHTLPDNRAQQGEAYCGRCFGVRQVIGHVGAYDVKCLRCPYGSHKWADRTSAYRAAIAHMTKTRHDIRVGAEILRVGEQLSLW
jgi:hypothetical protein